MATGGEGDTSVSLKEALVESLAAILSHELHIRNAGEEHLKTLEVTEEFGVHLAELTLNPEGPLAIRQLASVLLRQYVEAHWSPLSEKFRQPETTEEAKVAIRQMLPHGLKETISKVRSSVAYAISAIAHWDWPEAWPELFQILMQALAGGNPDLIHGAMRVLTEFCRDVTDTQMPQVAPVILPEMLKIFSQQQGFGIRTRGRAVNIFDTCAGTIAAMNDYTKGVAKQLLYPLLPQFLEAFLAVLQVPDGPTSDSGLKMEILKALTTLIKSFPNQMSQFLPSILEPVWLCMTQNADVYVRTVVNGVEEPDDPVDSDGEVLGFENLVLSVFDFIHAMIEAPKFRQMVRKSADQLVYYIILYMQMTEDQIRQWTANPDQFVEDEDDDSYSYSVRISALDLLLAIAAEFPKDAAPALCSAVNRHLQEAHGSQGNWWKIHEAVMLAIGSLSKMVMSQLNGEKLPFDIDAFLQNIVLANLNQNVSPFLLGRCLWVSSRYAKVMHPDILQRCLQATVAGINTAQPACVRISAVRAVAGFCEHLRSTEAIQVLQPVIGEMMEGLMAIATQFSSDVLGLCLETIYVVLEVDRQFTGAVESKVSPLVIAIFLKYSSDPLIVSLSQDIFTVLVKNDLCICPLQHRLVPTMLTILQSPVDKLPLGMQSVALDILTTLVRWSPVPLSEILVSQAFPAVVQCTLQSDDNSCLQSGGECLRSFVSVALDQITQWHDAQGCNGVFYIVQVISKLLDPKTSEYTATYVGRLVSILISKMGSQLGDNLDLMLRAVLSKLQQAETLSVVQSLVLVFAHLLHTQMEAVLQFLSNVPSPTGKTALEFVLTEWCAKQHLFFGEYDRRVSAVALCKLIHHTLATNDPRLQSIEVQGEMICHIGEGVKTRSKAALVPDHWTRVPLLVKIYKLLINELSNQIENNLSTRGAASDDNEEEDGEWEDEEDDVEDDNMNGDDSPPGILSQIAASEPYQEFELDGEEKENDPDALNDPIYQIDLQAYLTEFLQTLSKEPCYAMFCQHHNDSERHVLHMVGIHV